MKTDKQKTVKIDSQEAVQRLLRALPGVDPADVTSPETGRKVPGVRHQGREYYTLTSEDLKVRAGNDYRVPIDPLLTNYVLGHAMLSWEWVNLRWPRIAPVGVGGNDVVPGTTFQYSVMDDSHWREPPNTRLPEASPVRLVKTTASQLTSTLYAHGLGTYLTDEEQARAGALGRPYIAQVLALPEALMRNALMYAARTLLEDTTPDATHGYINALAAGSEWDHANNAAGGAAYADLYQLVDTVATNAGVTHSMVELGIPERSLTTAFGDKDIQARTSAGFRVAPGSASARADALAEILGCKAVHLMQGVGFRSGTRGKLFLDQVYAWVNAVSEGQADRFGGSQAGVRWGYNDGQATAPYFDRERRVQRTEFLWDYNLHNEQPTASGIITNTSTT